jgi:hypothetical protein
MYCFLRYLFCLLQDPYIVRPLPHLIGSVKFLQDDDVGIGIPESEGQNLQSVIQLMFQLGRANYT